MSRSFKPSDLPNPILLTDPANIAFMQKALEKEKKAEAALAPITNNQKKRKADDASGSSKSAKKPKKTATGGGDDGGKDLFSIALPGDEDSTVEIYDSCDELRRKINALLRTGTITKAGFMRDIARAAPSSSDFLTKKGATSGSTSRVCYASYVYFEKKRMRRARRRASIGGIWRIDGLGKAGGCPGDGRRSISATLKTLVQDALGSIRVIPGGRYFLVIIFRLDSPSGRGGTCGVCEIVRGARKKPAASSCVDVYIAPEEHAADAAAIGLVRVSNPYAVLDAGPTEGGCGESGSGVRVTQSRKFRVRRRFRWIVRY
ncbi:hypothetical protein B0H14DRAFT_3141521 [Mycena olivaceomarginata]|nr:hypothetical protein B0H14DRAFT_3141521 [Mycena olivaceomarginata]